MRWSRLGLVVGLTALGVASSMVACDTEAPRRRTPAPLETEREENAPGEDATVAVPEQPPTEDTNTPQIPDVKERLPGFWTSKPLGPSLFDPARATDIVVRAGDRMVTLDEIDLQLRGQPRSTLRHLAEAAGRSRFVEDTADFVVAAAEARNRGITDQPAVQFETLAGLATAERQHFYDTVRDEIPRPDVEAWYEENKIRYQRPELRAGVLFVAVDEVGATTMRQTLLTRAPENSSRRTRTFLELSRASSVDEETKRQSGRLNPLPAAADGQSERDRVLATALFGLERYHVSEVFALENGWGFAMLESVIEPRDEKLPEVERQIRTFLASRKAPAEFDAYLAKAREQAVVHPEILALLHGEDAQVSTLGYSISISDEGRDAAVVSVGETTINGSHAVAALGRWPKTTQERVLNGSLHDPFMDKLVAIATMAEAARVHGLADHPLVHMATDRIAVTIMQRDVYAAAAARAVTDADVRAYYDEHPEQYSRPERRRGIQIVVATKAEADAIRDEILRRAPDATRKRSDVGKELAASRSVDEHVRDNEGKLPYVSELPTIEGVEVPDEIRARLFGLEIWGVGDPVEVPLDERTHEKGTHEEGTHEEGTHWVVVILDGIRPGENLTFERSQASIRRTLEQEPSRAAWRDLVAAQRASTEVELHPELLEGIRIDFEGHAGHEH